MKCLTYRKFNALLLAKAKIRPGVPTTICGQFFFNTSSSFFVGKPPKNTETLIVGTYLQKRSYSRLI
jgi:hypothetical protein